MLKSKLAKNSISSVILKLVTIICGFIVPRLILEAYGSDTNGLLNSVKQFLGVISFLELGVGSVVKSTLYKPLADNDIKLISAILLSAQKFFNKIGMVLFFYVVVLIIIFPFIINDNYSFFYIGTLIISVSVSMFAQYFFGMVNMLLLTADQCGYVTYNMQTVTLIINTLLCYFFIRFGFTIQIVALTTSFVYILRPIFYSIYVKKHYKIDMAIKYTGEPIKQKWNGFAQHIASVIMNDAPTIILTFFAPLSTISIYSVYNFVLHGVKNIAISFTSGIQPFLGHIYAKNEMERLNKIFSFVEWLINTGTTLIFGIAGILLVPFIKVYTEGITDVNYIIPSFAYLITIAHAGHCYRLPYNIMILAAGHYKETQSNYVIAALINIICSCIFVKIWGIHGIAIGMILAMFYQTIWMAIYNSKFLMNYSMKHFYKQIFSNLINISLMFWITAEFSMSNISYSAWFILAVKVTIVSILVSFIINFIFYREKIEVIVSKLSIPSLRG